jgi:hypothetical protein
MHHNEKPGLPRRFTTHFDTFCPNPKNDTGLPFQFYTHDDARGQLILAKHHTYFIAF